MSESVTSWHKSSVPMLASNKPYSLTPSELVMGEGAACVFVQFVRGDRRPRDSVWVSHSVLILPNCFLINFISSFFG